MRILVTGGAGFIGAALTNRLVAEGHHVRVLDDLSAGDRSRLDPRAVLINADIRDVPKLWTALNGVECIYHLAARVSVPESLLYPVEYNNVNVGGTVSLLTAARDARVKRLIFASSGAAYGEQERQPVPEDAVLRPSSPYAVSKMAAEQYVLAIGANWGLETVILRIFNAYGPGQPVPPSHGSVVPRFLRQAVAGGSVVVFGRGEQTRDFVYLDDAVEALVRAGMAGEIKRAIINIGSGTETSIWQLVDAIEAATGQEVHRLYNAERSGGVSRLVADISRAQELLGFQPRTDLVSGLRLMLERDPAFAPE
jgi:UDP-glucose 4-epimerase